MRFNTRAAGLIPLNQISIILTQGIEMYIDTPEWGQFSLVFLLKDRAFYIKTYNKLFSEFPYPKKQ